MPSSNETEKKIAWRRYFYVFIGGYHFSGTSIMQRLLASQEWALGIQPGSIRSLPQCARSNCKAPENEGVFLSRAFHSKTIRCTAKPWDQSGRCAQEIYDASLMIAKSVVQSQEISQNLWNDWSPFWRPCSKKINYLIDKDIPVLYWWPLLASSFGERRTSFIFTIRHPLDTSKSRSRGFKNRMWSPYDNSLKEYEENDATFIHWWLTGYRVAIRAINELERILFYQLERLRENPEAVLKFITQLLDLPVESIQYDYKDYSQLKKETNITRTNNRSNHRQLGFYKSKITQDGKVTIIGPSSLTPVTWTFKNESDHENFQFVNNEIRSMFCYDLYFLGTFKADSQCKQPVLAFRKLANSSLEATDLLISKCAWTPAIGRTPKNNLIRKGIHTQHNVKQIPKPGAKRMIHHNHPLEDQSPPRTIF